MKIRNGFVSNSSSSSFVVAQSPECKTVFDVARTMIPARGWTNDKVLINKLNQLENGPLKMNPDTPILFNSCNFETYIFKVDDIIFVETCNNHDWDNYIDCFWGGDNKLIMDVFNQYVDEDYKDDFYPFQLMHKLDIEFYFLELDLRVKYIRDYREREYCSKPDHYSEFYVIDGKKRCPYCYRKELDDKRKPKPNVYRPSKLEILEGENGAFRIVDKDFEIYEMAIVLEFNPTNSDLSIEMARQFADYLIEHYNLNHFK